LSGNATAEGSIYNYGILSPGNSIGTVNTTNLILGPSSLLLMEVNSAGQSDEIIASGVAELDGTLEIIPLPGSYTAAENYTLITAADGVTGTFSTIESSVPALVHVTYDPTSVVADVLPLSALRLSTNALNAATCFVDTTLITGSDFDIINAALLSSTLPEISAAFDLIQPSLYSALAWTQIQNALLVRSSYSQHLEALDFECCPCGCNIWAAGMGQWLQQDTRHGNFGYFDTTGGATVGADTIYNAFRLGAAASYTYSHINWRRSAGHSNANSVYGGLYGDWTDGCFYANASFLGAYTKHKTNRHLHFSTIDRHAHSRHNSWEWLASAKVGYNLRYECTDIMPFIQADYVNLSQQKLHERGAGSLAIGLNKHRDQVVQSEVGVVFTNQSLCANWLSNWTVIPLLKLSYINQTSLSKNHHRAHFTSIPTCNFDVSGWNFQRNLGAVSFALDRFDCCETFGVTIRYDGQFGSNYWVQSANVTINWKF
jgi:outer membrane autotransporter protein